MPSRMLVLVASALVAVCSQTSAIVITDVGTAFTENFDSLASSGTNNALPTSWSLLESGSSNNADGSYVAGTGSSNTANAYSFGAAGSTDRALGGLRAATLIPLFGVQLTNATGLLLDSLDIGFTGEQWRLGALSRTDRLDFQFSTDATSLMTGNWTEFDSLDFVAPTTTGTVGALSGNAAANRVALAATIVGLAWADGASLWLRWSDFDATGADDGLAVDDFSVTAQRPVSSGNHAVPDTWPTAIGLGVVLAGVTAVRRRLCVIGEIV